MYCLSLQLAKSYVLNIENRPDSRQAIISLKWKPSEKHSENVIILNFI